MGRSSSRLCQKACIVTELVEPLFVHRVRGRISSSPLLVDANRDGWPEVFVGGRVLSGLTWDGEVLPRWPRRARRPFASSPAFGDINGDGRGELVVGCDDGRVYAFYLDGELVRGWPVVTGRDVFSTPALADINGDGALETLVGSDDGTVYAIAGDGRKLMADTLPGRPFISGSPVVADLDGDNILDVAVGAWDRTIHLWTAAGTRWATELPRSGHVIWSSPLAIELRGKGKFLAWASDRVFVASADGSLLDGWPAKTGSWMASSPAVVEFQPGEGGTLIVGAEKLYAWDLAGRLRPHWPVEVGDYVWSSPIAFDMDGDGAREVLVGSWSGEIHAVRPNGEMVPGFPLGTSGPVFSSLAAAPLREGGGLLVAASWDGTVRGWRLPNAQFRPGDWLTFRGSALRTGVQSSRFEPPRGPGEIVTESEATSTIRLAHAESWARGRGLHRVVVEGDHLGEAKAVRVVYEISGEGSQHPVPVVNSRGRFVALIQPLRLPRQIRYWVELERSDGTFVRWPEVGVARFLSRTVGGG